MGEPVADTTEIAVKTSRPLLAVAQTNRLGVIEAFDGAAAELLNCEASRATGSLLLGFIDPVSQRQYLQDMHRARRGIGTLTSRLFLRPRRRLPISCQATVRPVRAGEAALQWNFRPEGDEAGITPTPEAIVSATLQAREEAARRLARDLHDDAGQMLAALHLAIDAAGRDLPEPARTRVLAMRGLVRSVEEQLRMLSHEIRLPPIEELGLAGALEALGRSLAIRTATKVTVKALYGNRLPASTEVHLYRIAQEALTNAVRHGQPRRINVRLNKCGEKVMLFIMDDGRGFDVAEALAVRAARGIGLIGIQERVEAIQGTLSVESRPGKGTTITVTAPRCL